MQAAERFLKQTGHRPSLPPRRAEANTLKLHVTSTVGAGTPTELDANPDDTIRSVVEQVATAQAIDPNSISLVKNGKPLDLDRTLKQCGLKDKDTLKAMPRDPIGG